jgi:hypothetical protein
MKSSLINGSDDLSVEIIKALGSPNCIGWLYLWRSCTQKLGG